MYFLCDAVRCVCIFYGASSLKDDVAVIVMLVDVVNGDARFPLFCGEDGFMNVHSEHPLSAEFGQKRRMNVHHPLVECPDEVCRG